MVDVVKGLKRVTKEINALAGDTYSKGDLFENYAQKLFPDQDFKVVHYTTRRDELDGRKIESAQNPDFQFEHRRSGHRFWVECKWRGDLYDGKLDWCKDYQFKRYKEFQEEVRPQKVYAVIGLDGLS
jgi:hypothetical protein